MGFTWMKRFQLTDMDQLLQEWGLHPAIFRTCCPRPGSIHLLIINYGIIVGYNQLIMALICSMFFSSAIYITFPKWPKCRYAIDGAYRNHQKLMITFFGFQTMTHDIHPGPPSSFGLARRCSSWMVNCSVASCARRRYAFPRAEREHVEVCWPSRCKGQARSGRGFAFFFCSYYSQNSQILLRSWDAGEISPVMFIGLESSQNYGLYPPWAQTWTKWCASTYGKRGPHLENLAISLLKWMGIFQFPTLNCQRIPQGKR